MGELFFLSSAVYAKNSAPEIIASQVEWFKPDIIRSKSKKKIRFAISGRTIKGSLISFTSEGIPYITNKDEVQLLPTNEVVKSAQPIYSDEDGYFEFYLELPYGHIQLPVKISTPDGQPPKIFELKLLTDKDQIILESKNPLKNSPLRNMKNNIWLAAGYNFLRYNQTTRQLPSDLTFETFKGPSFFGSVVLRPSSYWTNNISFGLSPGETTSSPSVSVQSGSYNWQILTVDTTYWPEKWFYNTFQIGALGGIQYHKFPFIKIESGTPPGAKIDNLYMAVLELGFNVLYKPYPRWGYELFMAYQLPFTNSAEIQIRPEVMFNGSIGGYYKYSPKWYLGCYWYGQLHNYNYSSYNSSYSTTFSGRQNLFFSNIEFRLGYEL